MSLLLSGCAGLRPWQAPDSAQDLPAQMLLEQVHFYPQERYQCGPAALAMAFSATDLAVAPEALVEAVYSPARKGSLQASLISAARRHGRLAYPISGMEALLTEVSAGHAVIVLQNLAFNWYPRWHYAVVVGYDLDKKEIVLHSGLNQYERLSMRVFNNTWLRGKHWGLLVLRPEDMPATAQEGPYLEAVLGLEQVKLWPAAGSAYQQAVKRWPQNTTAWIGLANSYYAQQQLTEAEQALRSALATDPESGVAYNNLAQVLFELGRNQEALDAAQQAVARGGPHRNVFQKTLEEIQAAMP